VGLDTYLDRYLRNQLVLDNINVDFDPTGFSYYLVVSFAVVTINQCAIVRDPQCLQQPLEVVRYYLTQLTSSCLALVCHQ
jgi:hypothetical protein